MSFTSAEYQKFLDVLPIEAFAIKLCGSIVYANAKGQELLANVGHDASSFFEYWNDDDADVSALARRCAGSSSWQPITLRHRSGPLKGLPVKLRGRGMLPESSSIPFAILVSDSGRGLPFEEHTRLVKALNAELTRLRELEEQLLIALSKERRLHRELVHRVKNNLTVLSALVGQRAQASKNKDVANALADIQSRIHSLGIIHQLLDQTQAIDVIDGASMIETLCSDLEHALCPPGVSILRDLDAQPLHVADATPLLLVVNELVTNALKHAFHGQTSGHVKVSLRQNGVDKLEVSIADNGRGFDQTHDDFGSGSKIVSALASQLGGELSVQSGSGTNWQLVFPRTEITPSSE